ncbi:hypothetical protein BGX38DRAFT_1216816, partial [Terfezia claveryi]
MEVASYRGCWHIEVGGCWHMEVVVGCWYMEVVVGGWVAAIRKASGIRILTGILLLARARDSDLR